MLRWLRCFLGPLTGTGNLWRSCQSLGQEQDESAGTDPDPGGRIRLAPTADGYLEAVLSGRFEGLVLLVFEGKLKNVVAGTRFGHYLTPKLRIPLK